MLRKEWSEQKLNMFDPLFLVPGQVNQMANADVLPDSGCNTYSLIDSSFVRKHRLQRIQTRGYSLSAYDDRPSEQVDAVVKFHLNIGGVGSTVWAYEVRKLKDYDIILGTPWLRKNDVVIRPEGPSIVFENHQIEVPSVLPKMNMQQIFILAF